MKKSKNEAKIDVKYENINTNRNRPPFIQITPQEVDLIILPNEQMEIKFLVSVSLDTF